MVYIPMKIESAYNSVDINREKIVKSYSCDIFTINDNNNHGQWKMTMEDYRNLIKNEHLNEWMLIITEEEITSVTTSSYYIDRIEHIVKYGIDDKLDIDMVNQSLAGAFPHRSMAESNFYEITGKTIQERGPSLDREKRPCLLFRVSTLEDLFQKRYRLATYARTKNTTFDKLDLSENLIKDLFFVRLNSA